MVSFVKNQPQQQQKQHESNVTLNCADSHEIPPPRGSYNPLSQSHHGMPHDYPFSNISYASGKASNTTQHAPHHRYHFPIPSYLYNSSDEGRNVSGCTCKKSRCLKLYCCCMANSTTCGPTCKCSECLNVPEHASAIQEARRAISIRNPVAFDGQNRFSHTNSSALSAISRTGCNCKRSNCLKKYCECFTAESKCSDKHCKCINCKNIIEDVLVERSNRDHDASTNQDIKQYYHVSSHLPPTSDVSSSVHPTLRPEFPRSVSLSHQSLQLITTGRHPASPDFSQRRESKDSVGNSEPSCTSFSTDAPHPSYLGAVQHLGTASRRPFVSLSKLSPKILKRQSVDIKTKNLQDADLLMSQPVIAPVACDKTEQDEDQDTMMAAVAMTELFLRGTYSGEGRESSPCTPTSELTASLANTDINKMIEIRNDKIDRPWFRAESHPSDGKRKLLSQHQVSSSFKQATQKKPKLPPLLPRSPDTKKAQHIVETKPSNESEESRNPSPGAPPQPFYRPGYSNYQPHQLHQQARIQWVPTHVQYGQHMPSLHHGVRDSPLPYRMSPPSITYKASPAPYFHQHQQHHHTMGPSPPPYYSSNVHFNESPCYETRNIICGNGLPKSLSFRKICSRCGKTRGEHGEMGFGNKCTFSDCAKCGATLKWHEMYGQSMGVTCQLKREQGAIPGAAHTYERKLLDLATRAELELRRRREEKTVAGITNTKTTTSPVGQITATHPTVQAAVAATTIVH